MSLGYFTLSFLLGILLVLPYLMLVNTLESNYQIHALGSGLVIAALIYVGFAFYQSHHSWLAIEMAGSLAYGGLVWWALRSSMLWLALGWGAHPLWDVALHWLGPGAHIVPPWYAIACLSFDLLVAIYILRIYRIDTPARTSP